jgi:Cu-Zn family superoxide dismutase
MNRKHGTASGEGPHMGDLPNLLVDAQGRGYIEALIKMATLDGSAMGLLDADGTAIVIHAGPDDNMTDPSGNSGARVVCGVVKAD